MKQKDIAKRMALIQDRKRRQRVRDMMLHGGVSYEEMARSQGVRTSTIKNDIAYIQEEWMREDIEQTAKMKSVVTRQLLFSAGKAMTSFELSKQPEEEITVTRTPKACKLCHGSGEDDDEGKCPACLGEGQIFTERQTRKVKGQAGDASFLNTYNKSLEQLSKIWGLQQKDQSPKTTNKLNMNETHFHIGNENGSSAWGEKPRRLLLEALGKLDEAKDIQKILDVKSGEEDTGFEEMEPSQGENPYETDDPLDDKQGQGESP